MNEAPVLLAAQQIRVLAEGRTLLRDISLQIRRGEIVTVIGPNGAGKSTLLKALLGLMPVASGSVSRATALRLGYMPQRLQLNPLLPIRVGRFLAQTGANRAQILAALSETGVAELCDHPLQSISGGELQRVLLARTLLRQPDLLVLDEPTQGVDINGQAALYELIASLRDRYRCGVLLVSHDLHLVMAATDTVICLNQHICCQGHPEHVSQHPEYLQLFGRQAARNLAVYTHHHDHNHDVHGNILAGQHTHSGDCCRHGHD